MATGSLHHTSVLENALTGCRGGELLALLSLLLAPCSLDSLLFTGVCGYQKGDSLKIS